MSFAEFLELKHHFSKSDLIQMTREAEQEYEKHMDLLFFEFETYLIHGGYLTAINDMAAEGRILNSTLNTYSDWIRGDFLKRGKTGALPSADHQRHHYPLRQPDNMEQPAVGFNDRPPENRF